jgi:hypothetical protein
MSHRPNRQSHQKMTNLSKKFSHLWEMNYGLGSGERNCHVPPSQ